MSAKTRESNEKSIKIGQKWINQAIINFYLRGLLYLLVRYQALKLDIHLFKSNHTLLLAFV